MSGLKKRLTKKDAKTNGGNQPTKASSGKKTGKPINTPSFGSQIIILFMTMGIAAIMIITLAFHDNLTFDLPLIVVLSLIMFLVSLTLASVVLTQMGLACKSEAWQAD